MGYRKYDRVVIINEGTSELALFDDMQEAITYFETEEYERPYDTFEAYVYLGVDCVGNVSYSDALKGISEDYEHAEPLAPKPKPQLWAIGDDEGNLTGNIYRNWEWCREKAAQEAATEDAGEITIYALTPETKCYTKIEWKEC